MKETSNVYLLGFLFTLCIVIMDSSGAPSYPNRQRATRGFKNAALSTARGFGKRDGFPINRDDAAMDYLFDFKKDSSPDFAKVFPKSERYSISWLVNELSRNSNLSRMMNRKMLDKDEVVPEDVMTAEDFPRNLEY